MVVIAVWYRLHELQFKYTGREREECVHKKEHENKRANIQNGQKQTDQYVQNIQTKNEPKNRNSKQAKTKQHNTKQYKKTTKQNKKTTSRYKNESKNANIAQHEAKNEKRLFTISSVLEHDVLGSVPVEVAKPDLPQKIKAWSKHKHA